MQQSITVAALHWTDWVGLALLAYGLVAGFARGWVHQSTRLIVIVLAVGLASFARYPADWAAGILGEEMLEDPGYVPLVGLVVFCVSVGALNVLRGLLFFWQGPPTGGFGSRAAGAALGVVGATLTFLLAASVVAWQEDPGKLEPANHYPFTRDAVAQLEKLPDPPRPAFFDSSRFPSELPIAEVDD